MPGRYYYMREDGLWCLAFTRENFGHVLIGDHYLSLNPLTWFRHDDELEDDD